MEGPLIFCMWMLSIIFLGCSIICSISSYWQTFEWSPVSAITNSIAIPYSAFLMGTIWPSKGVEVGSWQGQRSLSLFIYKAQIHREYETHIQYIYGIKISWGWRGQLGKKISKMVSLGCPLKKKMWRSRNIALVQSPLPAGCWTATTGLGLAWHNPWNCAPWHWSEVGMLVVGGRGWLQRSSRVCSLEARGHLPRSVGTLSTP